MRVYKVREPKKDQPEQVSLGLAPTMEELIADTKYRLKSKQHEIELQPLWKSFPSILALVTSVMLGLLVLIGSLVNFADLPPEVPAYYDTTIETWRSIDKIFLIISPLVYWVVIALMIRLISKVFIFDKRLALLASWLIVFANLMSFFAFGQLASLFNIVP